MGRLPRRFAGRPFNRLEEFGAFHSGQPPRCFQIVYFLEPIKTAIDPGGFDERLAKFAEVGSEGAGVGFELVDSPMVQCLLDL